MEEKYGITDAHYICDSAIFNTETDEILRLYQICDLLNEQDQKIKDLEAKLEEKEKEIVDKIRSKCCVEDKCKDGSFVLGINEKDLDTILKEYQK